MTVDISEIKATLASSSQEIAADYLATFPNCRTSDVAGIDLSGDLDVTDLPACKPGGKDLARFEEVWTNAFEDVFNSLPSSISLVDVLPLQQTITNKFFNNYSLVRWGFRLLPIVSILLLTLIAVLLRNQREVMWKWCGRLLVIVSGLTLIGLVVLMIGFDQFVAMLLNPVLQNLISGFGFILLGVVQDVGFQVLVWVVISALIVMGFGLLLMLAVKFIRPRKEKPAEEEEPDVLASADEAGELAEPGEKEFQPETLEEVEEREKEIKNGEDDTADGK
jgi:hypothetical protein